MTINQRAKTSPSKPESTSKTIGGDGLQSISASSADASHKFHFREVL